MQQLNLYIFSDKPLLVCGLKHYLKKKFGSQFNILNFYDRKTCLRKINKQTSIVIVDDEGKTTSSCMGRSIKTLYPKVEVIEHSTNEAVAAEISTLCFNQMEAKQEQTLFKAAWN